MRTAGIDLAAQPKATASCVVEWRQGRAVVLGVGEDQSDDDLVRVAQRAEKVGIDCPLGWPDPFVEAVLAHRDREPWPGRAVTDQAGFRRRLSLRATDLAVIEAGGGRPLSVSTDRIGVAAMRCALILDRLGESGVDVDRVGRGRIVEAYPAATLARWGLPARGYKGAKGRPTLSAIVTELARRAQWLDLGEHAGRFARDDHCFDALVCALVARAAALGATLGSREVPEVAAREGWIHLPEEGSLERLAGD